MSTKVDIAPAEVKADAVREEELPTHDSRKPSSVAPARDALSS
jgi:hypothetical protein